MYQVILKHEAEKFLFRKLDRKTQEKVGVRIDLLAKDPFSPNTNLNKIKEMEHGYRLRIGDIRIIYEVDTTAKILTLWKIDWRAAVYKK